MFDFHVLDDLIVDNDVEPTYRDGSLVFELFPVLDEVELTKEREPLAVAGFEFVEVDADVRVDVRGGTAGEDFTERAVFAAADFEDVVFGSDEATGEAPAPEVRRVVPVEGFAVAVFTELGGVEVAGVSFFLPLLHGISPSDGGGFLPCFIK